MHKRAFMIAFSEFRHDIIFPFVRIENVSPVISNIRDLLPCEFYHSKALKLYAFNINRYIIILTRNVKSFNIFIHYLPLTFTEHRMTRFYILVLST